MRATFFVMLCGGWLLACRDDQDPDGAAALWQELHPDGQASYRDLARAPGYAERTPSDAPHSDQVDIYVNDVVEQALTTGATSWPDGSLIVKDGFDDDGELQLVAAMEKRAGSWYWVEWNADGESLYSGQPDVCLDCHRSGSDFVRALSLP